ncbi:hypothetical protein PR048_023966 [Dryococelus australis]|uniref:Uncharacterized protein n=1 Tax=Dryococelus australis TaxID=614101 RepID=A0ABQ9GVI9_9NEOP|nr:hypothetical protein PR048_023966 [Dryococelus australis]
MHVRETGAPRENPADKRHRPARLPYAEVRQRTRREPNPPAHLPQRRTVFNSRPGNARIFAGGNRAGRCRWSGGFSRGSPVSSALSFLRCSILTSLTLIGSQDLAVRSGPNLSWKTLVSACATHTSHPTSVACDYPSDRQPAHQRRLCYSPWLQKFTCYKVAQHTHSPYNNQRCPVHSFILLPLTLALDVNSMRGPALRGGGGGGGGGHLEPPVPPGRPAYDPSLTTLQALRGVGEGTSILPSLQADPLMPRHLLPCRLYEELGGGGTSILPSLQADPLMPRHLLPCRLYEEWGRAPRSSRPSRQTRLCPVTYYPAGSTRSWGGGTSILPSLQAEPLMPRHLLPCSRAMTRSGYLAGETNDIRGRSRTFWELSPSVLRGIQGNFWAMFYGPINTAVVRGLAVLVEAFWLSAVTRTSAKRRDNGGSLRDDGRRGVRGVNGRDGVGPNE